MLKPPGVEERMETWEKEKHCIKENQYSLIKEKLCRRCRQSLCFVSSSLVSLSSSAVPEGKGTTTIGGGLSVAWRPVRSDQLCKSANSTMPQIHEIQGVHLRLCGPAQFKTKSPHMKTSWKANCHRLLKSE